MEVKKMGEECMAAMEAIKWITGVGELLQHYK